MENSLSKGEDEHIGNEERLGAGVGWGAECRGRSWKEKS